MSQWEGPSLLRRERGPARVCGQVTALACAVFALAAVGGPVGAAGAATLQPDPSPNAPVATPASGLRPDSSQGPVRAPATVVKTAPAVKTAVVKSTVVKTAPVVKSAVVKSAVVKSAVAAPAVPALPHLSGSLARPAVAKPAPPPAIEESPAPRAVITPQVTQVPAPRIVTPAPRPRVVHRVAAPPLRLAVLAGRSTYLALLGSRFTLPAQRTAVAVRHTTLPAASSTPAANRLALPAALALLALVAASGGFLGFVYRLRRERMGA